jgi:hypothetical protein
MSNHNSNLGGNGIIVVAGSNGYVGQVLCGELRSSRIEHFRLPPFRTMSSTDISKATPPGLITLINCAGKTPSPIAADNTNFAKENIDSLERLLNAYKSRLNSVIHFSTAHLNILEEESEYFKSKMRSELLILELQKEIQFEANILRLPSLWSRRAIKKGSLLHDIVLSDFSLRSLQVRNPKIKISVTTDSHLSCLVHQILNGMKVHRDFNFDYSWNGELVEFLDLVLLSKSSRELPVIIREIRDLINFLRSNRTFTLL